ncbi:hypothetical protein U91I_00224 [alpha proteobacterium U9-1i]|nr:hypothetical protein U91I_00224 [alpha proteobacterium U9-1i]
MHNADAAIRIDRGAWSWAFFEWGRNPFVLLCTIYVLGPFIATVVIGDPIRGQEIISGWHKMAGIIVALTAPFLGAAADRMGRRKPLLLAILAIMAPAILLQYFARPDGEGLPLWLLGAVLVTSNVCFAWSEVLHNSMLPNATKPALVSRLSGLGLALGNAASVLLLIFVLFAFALPGQVDWPFLPQAPLFGLNAAEHEPSRIVAPIAAIWLVAFAVPLFLYTPDLVTTGQSLGAAIAGSVGNVMRTLRKLRDYQNIALFLLARMFYADGKIAILIFGGVYAAGVLGWDLIELLAFGVILSVCAVFGGFAGGWLDERFGPKRAVLVEIGVTLVCLITMVSMSAEHIFFFVAVDPNATAWNGPIFRTAPELGYLAAAMLIAVSITAAFASSRTMMARLAPRGMEGELFGLYALSNAATAWLAPLLVEYFTRTYQSQQAGFAAIALLLLAGLALLFKVTPPETISATA